MATASSRGWAYYYKIRTCNDHMDTLKLYTDYKSYWNKHRIPGETKVNEVLWEDPWWKINSPFRRPRKLPPIHGAKDKKNKDQTAAKTENQDEKTPEKVVSKSTHVTLPAIKKSERRDSSSSSSSED